MGELRMPSLGADMTEGKVLEWLVKPGDHIKRGDLIAEVDTEKTVMEVESFAEGTVAEYLVELGDVVPVGTPIVRIDGTQSEGDRAAAASEPAGEPPSPAAAPVFHVTPPVRRLAHQLGVDLDRVQGTGHGGSITHADVQRAADGVAQPEPQPEPQPQREPQPVTAPHRTGAGEHQRSSPAARRLAEELGVGLADVHGTGPGGAVRLSDVRDAATGRTTPRTVPPARGSAPRDGSGSAAEADRAAKLRRAVGALMARSKREIPHYYLSTTIDLGTAIDWMRRVNAGRRITERLVPSALLLAAAAKAAKRSPVMNGFFTEAGFEPSPAVNLGVAISLRGGGIVAPAIHGADTLTVDEVMTSVRDLVQRAKAGRLHRAEMADPTITVTNLGDLGVETIFGVIYPPQVALVGFGGVVERPVARDGMIGVRPTVTATLSADHRVSDGMDGSRFLSLIDELLQRPEEL